ncbi:MAG: AarF/ABC1/UbiB kinase family protein, partial [Bacteroidota bacterium]
YDVFDFGKPEFDQTIRHFTKEAPLSNEPRGSQHFIYTTRVHVGLYNILIKLGARVNTGTAKEILTELLGMEFKTLEVTPIS